MENIGASVSAVLTPEQKEEEEEVVEEEYYQMENEMIFCLEEEIHLISVFRIFVFLCFFFYFFNFCLLFFLRRNCAHARFYVFHCVLFILFYFYIGCISYFFS